MFNALAGIGKTGILLCLAFLFISTTISAQANLSNFTIAQRSSNQMTIDFKLDAWSIETQRENGIDYQTIKSTAGHSLLIDETETLPVFSTVVAIPDGMDAEVSYENTNMETINNFRLSYAAEIERAAGGNSLYPIRSLEVSASAQMRDFRVVSLNLCPFQLNPTTQQLNVIKSGKITLHFVPFTGGYSNSGAGYYSTYYDNLYSAMILNYEASRDELIPITKPVLLVIYPSTTNADYLTSLDTFVTWKKQKGYTVNIASTASAQAGSTTTTIKAYIQSQYNNLSTRPDVVVFMGDASGSYAVPSYVDDDGDYQYSLLAGGDQYGDVQLGRMSVSSSTDMGVLVAKTLAYERDVYLPTAGWLNKMLLVGDSESGGSGISTIYVNRYIHDISYFVNPSYTYTEMYGAIGSPASQINTAITLGTGFFNFRGYNLMAGWQPGGSNNVNKLNHGVFITCDTGSFVDETSRTEAYIRQGTSGSPTGGVTAIGMATIETHTAFNNMLDCAIFDGIFVRGMRSMGATLLYSKWNLSNLFGVSNTAQSMFFNRICNLMGDPTVEVFITIPRSFVTNAPPTLTTGSATQEFLIKDSGNIPVANAWVNLYQTTNCNVSGLTDADGRVVLSLPTTLTGNLTFTVSKHDFKPTQSTITISGGGIVYQSSTLDDDNSGLSYGNNNGIINAIETIEYRATLKNTSAAAISTITGILTTTDPYVEIIDSTLSYSNIAAGATAFNNIAARFSISPACPDNHSFTVRASGTSSAGVWSFAVPLLVRSPDLDYMSYSITGGTNAYLDPGETANFTTTIKNNGTESIADVTAVLRSMEYGVIVIDSTAYLGTIAAGVEFVNTSDLFRLHASSACLPGMTIPMEIYLSNAAGYNDTESFPLTIGSAAITDPLGQDAYGYYIYDTGDISYPECPIYQWEGIAPAEGGSGTLLSFFDPQSLFDDDGDVVNADAVELVTLPFTFSFYGIDYTQITVCSNGFIALGATQNADFRNGLLPGANGPNPMIAAFWDDLHIPDLGGGIYKYYDSALHSLIIEWYNLENSYNDTSVETFQVIMYDPLFYPTDTLDGPIKIQYKTFNNVDAGSTDTSGNYCTIGIKNQTGEVGLQYSFRNLYPTAAKPITNLSALYITTKPLITSAPILSVEQTLIFDSNDNGLLEPGETANLGIRLGNLGASTATNVSATISETDPYVSITQATALYGDIVALGSGINATYYTIMVAGDCPAGHTVSLIMNITATGGYSWARTISLQVHKPALALQSWLIDDIAGGNANGLLDTGEASWLIMNLQNADSVAVQNLILNITSNNANVVLGNPQIVLSSLAGLNTYQAASQVTVGGSVATGTAVTFTLNGSSDNTSAFSVTMISTVGLGNRSYDFEATNGAFTVYTNTTTGWAWGTSVYAGAYSGTKIWGCVLSGTYANSATYDLITPQISIGTGSTLSFRHRYRLEKGVSTAYDGGRVMISTYNGTTWSAYALLTPVGGYPYVSVNALGGPGYSGELLSWTQASFNLSAYPNQTIKLKWQIKTDSGTAWEGWFVDDVVISNCNVNNSSVGIAQGSVTLNPADADIIHTVVSAGSTYTCPSAAGLYKLRLAAGSYSIKGNLTGYSEGTANATVTLNGTVSNANLSLDYYTPPLHFTWRGQSNQIDMRWGIDARPTFLHYNIYRKQGADAWAQVSETSVPNYSVTLTQATWYDFKVTSHYNNGESSPTDIIHIVYPNDDSQAAPLAPANISTHKTANQIVLNWDEVTGDVNRNPLTPWEYRIYAADLPDFTPSGLNYLGSSIDPTWTGNLSAGELTRFYKVVTHIGY